MNSVMSVVLLAAVGGAYAAVSSGSGTRAPTGTRAVAVAKGTVLAMVSGSGALVSPSDVGVNFTTGGRVTEVDVKPGDKVTKGEVLAKVDATAANETLTQAQASLTAAQANLSKVEAGQASSTPTGSSGGSGSGSTGASAGIGGSATQPSGSVPTRSGATHSPTPSPSASPTGTTHSPTPSPSASPTGTTHSPTPSPSASPTGTSSPGAQNVSFVQAVADTATASPSASVDPVQLAQAQLQLIQAQNAVSAAQRAVAGTVLTSPVGGTAATVAGKVGETVSGTGSGSSSGSGSTAVSGNGSTGSSATQTGFVVITNPTGMQVTADFSEADALKLQPGQPATVTINAEPGTVLNATVLSISSLPVTSGSSGGGSGNSGSAVQYAATLNITSPITNLMIGLSASIQVVTGEASSALYVPTAAVSGTGTNRTVTVVKADGTTQRTSVTVGVEGDTYDQITSGLTQGEQVQIATVSSTGTGGFPGGAFPGGTRGGGGGFRPGGGGGGGG